MKTLFLCVTALLLSACHLGNTSAHNTISSVPRGSNLDTSLYRLSDFQALNWGKQADGRLLLQIQTRPVPAFWPAGINYEVKNNTLFVSVQKCMAKFPCPVQARFQTLNDHELKTTPLLAPAQADTMVQQVLLPELPVQQVVMLLMGNEQVYPVALMPKVGL